MARVAEHAMRSDPLTAGELIIWTARLEGDEADIAHYHAILSEDERARAGRFLFGRDRNRYVLAHGIVRTLLAMYVGGRPADLLFTTGRYGKPALAASPVQFNLSHSADRLLVALAAGIPVGADVEGPVDEATLEALVDTAFAPAERQTVERAVPGQRLAVALGVWTRKEAYLKALGIGFAAEDTPPPPPHCRFVEVALPDNYAGAVALLGPARAVRQCDWADL